MADIATAIDTDDAVDNATSHENSIIPYEVTKC